MVVDKSEGSISKQHLVYPEWFVGTLHDAKLVMGATGDKGDSEGYIID